MEQPELSTAQTHNSEIALCLHCDTPIFGKDSFCCVGCETAYHIINTAGLSHNENQSCFSVFANQNSDGLYNLILSVKGIHCASCIQLIENALYAEKDIVSARVNMSTERLTIEWDGKQERGDAFATIVTKLGYKLKPFDVSDEQSAIVSVEKNLLRCIAVAGFAAGNLMMISIGLWSTTGETMGLATRDFFHFVSALIALPAILYAGRPFFYSALAVLKERHTNMDVPISLAVILASLMSLFEAINHGEHIYFDSAVMLLFFLLIGRYLDARAKGKARESAQGLLAMLSGTASILKNGIQSTIPIRELREGMVVLVASGENIPADGTVKTGSADLDMSLITGETLPHHVKKGDTVFAGTTNLTEPIRIIVSKASDDSLLSDIVKLMEKAEQGQDRYVRMADKAAKLYIPVVHVMSLLTFIGWWLIMGQSWQPALLNAITVLIITCPCALGLAVPVVQVLASSWLMKRGILLKSGDALEKLASINTIILDKTGTLTLGKPKLLDGNYSSHNLQFAASLAAHSKHPLSQAICRAYAGELKDANNIKELPGKGVQASINGMKVKLGNRNWCGNISDNNHAILELWLSCEGKEPVCFTFSDQLREDAKQVIQQLHQLGLKTMLLSGDRMQTVRHMAKEVGIDDYHASLSPVEKSHHLEILQQHGNNVLMVGDGLNDALSLATATVSISPSTAIDITQNTADIVFQGDKLLPIYTAWQIARSSNRLVKQNFALAILYNAVAIPLAVMGYVTPLIAAIAMSVSSLVVIGNSFRLNLKRRP